MTSTATHNYLGRFPLSKPVHPHMLNGSKPGFDNTVRKLLKATLTAQPKIRVLTTAANNPRQCRHKFTKK